LGLVFFCSGLASLIFQVAWERLLTIYYGVGPVAITLIVSVYMLGLGLGSLMSGYLADVTRRRVAIYVAIETCLGAFGLLSLPYMDFLGRYTAGSSYWVASLCIFLFLCIPTLAMGMTLPLIVKIFNRSARDFFDTVAYLYFINTLGAAVGALVASYILISFLGLDRAIYVAAGIDFLLVAIILAWARHAPPVEVATAEAPPRSEPLEGALKKKAYILVLITGFLAIGYEISWFRVLEVLVKASPYAFSSVLAVYLTGIAFGSYGMSQYLKKDPAIPRRSLFFLLQALIGAYVLVSVGGYYYLTRDTAFGELTRASTAAQVHPAAILPDGFSREELAKLLPTLDIFYWPALFVLVPTLLMGASFPLIAHLALEGPDREGRTVGQVYFFNTVGNVLGGVLTGFLLLPMLGTEVTLLSLSLIAVSLVLFVERFPTRAIPLSWRATMAVVLVVTALALFPGRGRLFAVIQPPDGQGWNSYFEEGIDGVVMTYQKGEAVTNYINGLGHGSRPGYAFYSEAIEAISFARKIERVLIIGFGTGSFTETVLKLDGVKRITLVELNRTLLTNLRKMEVFRTILTDPRLDVEVDDGRRFLLRSAETYDLIMIDPLRTTTAYSNNLYSSQFFELVRRHLSDEGVFLVWHDEREVLPKTLASVFPHVRYYGLCSLASDAPLLEDSRRRRQVLDAFSPQERAAIERFDLRSRGDSDYVHRLGPGHLINQDWRPYCEYFLGIKIRSRLQKTFSRLWPVSSG
jgi:predicted membrane-bound spermidine synthase